MTIKKEKATCNWPSFASWLEKQRHAATERNERKPKGEMARVFSTKVIKARERAQNGPVWGLGPRLELLLSPAPVCFKWERQKELPVFCFVSGHFTWPVSSPPPNPHSLQLQPANSLAILMAIVAVVVVVVVWTAQPAAIMVRCCCFYFFLLLLRFFVSFFRFSFSAIICLAPSASLPLPLFPLSLLLFLHLGQLSFPAVH